MNPNYTLMRYDLLDIFSAAPETRLEVLGIEVSIVDITEPVRAYLQISVRRCAAETLKRREV